MDHNPSADQLNLAVQFLLAAPKFWKRRHPNRILSIRVAYIRFDTPTKWVLSWANPQWLRRRKWKYPCGIVTVRILDGSSRTWILHVIVSEKFIRRVLQKVLLPV